MVGGDKVVVPCGLQWADLRALNLLHSHDTTSEKCSCFGVFIPMLIVLMRIISRNCRV